MSAGSGSGLDQAVSNIVEYDAELAMSVNNIDTLRSEVADVRENVQVIEDAIAKVESLRAETKAFGDDLGKLKLILTLMGKASALKLIADTGKQMVGRVETFVDKVDDKLKALVTKIENSSVRTTLQKVDANLGKVDAALGQVEAEVTAQKEAFGSFSDQAAKLAVLSDLPIQTTGDLVAIPLAGVAAINDFFDDEDPADIDSVRDFVNEFDGDTPSGDFDLFLQFEYEMNKVFSLLDNIRKPLDAVYKVLKPIEPLLAAVDLVADLTVNPVIDFVLETIGADKLINSASGRVLALLPDTKLGDLDNLEAAFDNVKAALAKYDFNSASAYDFDGDAANDPDPFNVGEWVFDKLQAQLLETAAGKIGTLSAGGAGVAIKIPEGVRGASEPYDPDLFAGYVAGANTVNVFDLVMIGDDKDNTITATGGKNILYGAEGDDTLIGGPGEDTAIFAGPLFQYRFSRENDTAPVYVEHTSPKPGVSLDGRDRLEGIEKVSFLGGLGPGDPIDDATYTIAELFGTVNEIGPGDSGYFSSASSGLFLYTNGLSSVTLTGGQYDDHLIGTSGNDTLIGWDGGSDAASDNDVFDGVGGSDSIDGGQGIDTYVVRDDGAGGGNKAKLDLATPFSGVNFEIAGFVEAILTGVENVSVEDQREAWLFGDARNNELSSADQRDVLDGRAGHDVLRGGGNDDVLIGGEGIDSLFGDAGNDDLIAGDALRSGPELYDGGNGDFDVLYYTSDIDHLLSPADQFAWSRARPQSDSGSVHVKGDGTVDRIVGGTVVQTDTAVGIEGYVGSMEADTLEGAPEGMEPLKRLDGSGGDDVIYGGSTSVAVNAGAGTDTVYAGTGGADYSGDGLDTLDLSYVPNVRWLASYVSNGRLEAFAAVDQQDLSVAPVFNQGDLDGFGKIIGSDYEDEIVLTGNIKQTVHAGDGDDVIDVLLSPGPDDPFIVNGEAGNDTITLNEIANANGGDGDDEIFVTASSTHTVMVSAGAGNDFVFADTGNGAFDGGEDPVDSNGNPVIDRDFISAHPTSPDGGLNVDLLGGTVTSGSFLSATIANFEGAIGSFRDRDTLGGSADGDLLIGSGGNDILEGRAGIRTNPNAVTYYSVTNPTMPAYDASWTLEAVVTTEIDTGIQRIVSKPIGGAQTFSLAVINGKAHVRYDSLTASARSVEDVFVADGQPHRLAGRYDEAAQTLTLFVDGIPVPAGSLNTTGGEPRPSNGGPITIGDFSESFSQPFLGEIEEVRVWDAARSDVQLAAPFSAITNPASEPDLELAVRIDETGPVSQTNNGYVVGVVDKSSGNDLLYGGAGFDSLYGGDGDDLLHGGHGFDTLHGGPGSDTASYSVAAPGGNRGATEISFDNFQGLRIDLEAGETDLLGGSSGPTDVLISIENVIGSEMDDIIIGTNGANALDGSLGDDLIQARGGDDRIVVQGDDTANGEAGDDYFNLSLGNAVIDGGAGVDTLEFSSDGVIVYDPTLGVYNSVFATQKPVWADTGTTEARSALTPTDVFEAEPAFARTPVLASVPDDPAFNTILIDRLDSYSGTFSNLEAFAGGLSADGSATSGDDALTAFGGPTSIAGLAGNDTILGGAGNDTLAGDAGNDDIYGADGNDSVLAGSGQDEVQLGAGDDTGLGQGGNDTFGGGDGDDSLSGGFGADQLSGDEGNDTIDGDGGGDAIMGGIGNDSLFGGKASDTLSGGFGDDYLSGEGFTDSLDGDAGNDSLFGGGSSDTLNGGDGSDEIFGQKAPDLLTGGAGSDFLHGGADNDELRGGTGTDTLLGSTGNDRLYGGEGSDIFQFRANHGSFDRIYDFEDGTDTIEFTIGSVADITDLTLTDVLNGVDIDYGTGTVRVFHLSQTDFDNSDFVFL